MLWELIEVVLRVDECAAQDDELLHALIEADLLTPINEIIMRVNNVVKASE
jgi:hypothetical protein